MKYVIGELARLCFNNIENGGTKEDTILTYYQIVLTILKNVNPDPNFHLLLDFLASFFKL